VVGRRGQSTIATLLFGSVAGTLVQIAPVPVTVVP
jgi:nucleotide-binding universal stress UspA family protein